MLTRQPDNNTAAAIAGCWPEQSDSKNTRDKEKLIAGTKLRQGHRGDEAFDFAPARSSYGLGLSFTQLPILYARSRCQAAANKAGSARTSPSGIGWLGWSPAAL
jgi:hypothetical protein